MNTMTLPRKGLKKYDYNIDMEKKDLKKLTKGQLIKLLSKKVSNHEDLLDNDPFKDEVAQEPTKSRTGKWESIKSKPVPQKSVNEDIILPPPKGSRDRPPKPTRKPPPPPIPQVEDHIINVPVPKIKELNKLLRGMQSHME